MLRPGDRIVESTEPMLTVLAIGTELHWLKTAKGTEAHMRSKIPVQVLKKFLGECVTFVAAPLSLCCIEPSEIRRLESRPKPPVTQENCI